MDKRAGLKQHFKDESNRSMVIQHHKERMQLAKDNQETLVHLMEALVDFLDKKVTKTEVTNQLKSISTPDVDKAVVAINKLDKAITSNKVDIQPIRNELQAIKRELSLLPKDHAKQLDTIKVSNLKDIIIPKLDTSNLEKLIKNLKLVAEAPIINTEKTDIRPLLDEMANVVKSIQENKPLEKVEITNFPDQKVTDLAKIEKKLDESNKHLKKIVEKPTGGGGGGGGNGTPYIDSTGKPMNVELTSDGKIPVDVDMATEGIATAANQNPLDKYAIYATEYGATYNYICKEDKDGNWYIQRETISTGIRDYAVGTSDVATAWTGRAGQTYGLFSGAF